MKRLKSGALQLQIILICGLAVLLPLPSLARELALTLEQIIVTARKRDESLSDVPVTLSVFSGEALEAARINNVDNLIGKAPSLFVSQNQTFGPVKSETYITMRGVGATTPLEPAVAVFIDGVYQPKLAFDIGFLDLERVEILRGPQGALFGRNTQGGAINLVTKKPGNELIGKVGLNVDEHGTAGIKGSMNIPLIEDKLFWSVAAMYQQTDGYLHNATLDNDQANQDKNAWRTSLVWLPSDAFSWNLTLFGSDLSGGQVGAGVPTGSNAYVVLDNEQRDIADKSLGGSLTLEWDLANFSVTSITGYSDVETEVFFDLDASDVGFGNYQIQAFEQTSKSQELRVASNLDGSRWNWLVGAYYFESTYDQHRDFGLLDPSSPDPSVAFLFNPNNSVSENADFEREGWAFFGQASYRLTDNIEFTVGARTSSEEVIARQFGRVVLIGGALDSPYDNTTPKKFDGFSPMATLSFKPSDDSLIYGTISRGFRAGGFPKYPFEQSRTGIPFDNETSTNYELGVKSKFAGGRVGLDAAIYQIDIRDQQLGSQVDGPSGVPVEGIDNVGESTNRGVELEATVIPTDGLRLFVNLSFIEAKFDVYVDQNGTDRAGENVPYIPELTAHAGLDYSHELGTSSMSLTWRLSYSYIDDYIVGNGVGTFDPRIPISNSDFWNASVTLSTERWDVTLFADNFTDEFNAIRTWQSPFHNPSLFSYDTVLPPRTIGIKAEARWE